MGAFASGDLPAALSFLDTADARYRRLSVPTTPLRIDRCAVLLAAGLAADALAEADSAVRDMEQIRGWSTKKAELLLMAANCALAAARPQARPGLGAGRLPPVPVAAQRLVAGSCGSVFWSRPATQGGPVSAALLRQATRAAARLDELGASDAAQAHLLAGRIALDLGRGAAAERHLAAAARSRRRGPALARVSGWLGEALRAEAAGQPGRMLAACRRGLDGAG